MVGRLEGPNQYKPAQISVLCLHSVQCQHYIQKNKTRNKRVLKQTPLVNTCNGCMVTPLTRVKLSLMTPLTLPNLFQNINTPLLINHLFINQQEEAKMTDTARTHHDIVGRDQYPMTGRDRDQYQIIGRGDRDQYSMSNRDYSRTRQIAKAATAVTAGGSLLVLSGLTLVGTVIGLAVATPLLVIFSPVLVPAAITVALIITGFLSSGGFGIAAILAFSWIYKYATGEQPQWSDRLDSARSKLGSKAQDLKDRASYYGQQHQTGGEHDRDRTHGTQHTTS